MRHIILIITLFYCFSGYLRAEDPFLDSLKNHMVYTSQIDLAKQLKDSGIQYKNKGDYPKALLLYHASMDIYLEHGDSIGVANCYNNIGVVYKNTNKKELAIDAFYSSIELNSKINNRSGLSNNYLNLANFHFTENNLNKAITFFNKSKELLIKGEQTKTLANIYNGLGIILSDENYPNRDYEEANEEFHHALEIYEKLNDSTLIAVVLNNMGLLAEKQSNYHRALEYYMKSLEIKETFVQKKGRLVSYLNIGNIYRKLEQYNNSLDYYLKGLALAQEMGDAPRYLNLTSNIVQIKIALGDDVEANWYFNEYRALRDSLYNRDKTRQLVELQVMYETEQTERALEKQILATEAKTRENKHLTITLIAVSLLTILSVGFFLHRQNAREQLREQKEHIYQQKLQAIKQEQDLEVLNAMMLGQEKERQRIAEDLHDRLGAKLSAIRLFHTPEHHAENYAYISRLLNETIIETREISHNLASGTLEKFGLINALEDLFETLQATRQIQTRFSVFSKADLSDVSIDRTLLSIVQELTNNTIKHAEASSIHCQVSCFPDSSFNLVYEDNGKGFNVDQLNGQGIGLSNIKTRLLPFNGTLAIDSSPGKGATFIIDIPAA
ncbi:MAG: tetratricopeptide repeat protein [Cyclobacteriaceae bacterium]|nr:tetratricopeptide repeat protein [Cyclobacteriaceae bacterium]